MKPSTTRRARTALGLGLLVVGALALPGGGATGTSAATPSTRPSPEEPAVRDSWKAVDELIAEDRAQAALEMAERLQVAARRAGDVAGWTKGLLLRAQLEMALSGYARALSILRGEPWPEDATARLKLELAYV